MEYFFMLHVQGHILIVPSASAFIGKMGNVDLLDKPILAVPPAVTIFL